MKRRQRKPILDLNGEQADSNRRRWHNKYEQIIDEYSVQNGSTKNPLYNLVGHYESDGEADDKQVSANVLNDKVDDFLKEIQAIKPEKSNDQSSYQNKNHNYDTHYKQAAKSVWQECFDESTGYPYYWHMETNEVTWEIPEELRLKRNMPKNEVSPHNQFVHWTGSSTTTYPQMQNNIPDGMIPKEVVARNRNRQVGNQQKIPTEPQPVIPKLSQYSKDEDSDDGKIEMITSFGNDDSDSEDTSDESPKKTSEKVKCKERLKVKRSPSRKEPVQMGPSLPDNMVLIVHGPENLDSPSSNQEMENSSKDSNETVPLRNVKASLSNEVGLKSQNVDKKIGEVDENQSNSDDSEEVYKCARQISQAKVSLVPGYEDDSDNDDESVQKQNIEPKPLFPISDYYEVDNENLSKVSKNEIVCNDKLVKKMETRQTDSGCIRIFEYHSSETASTDKDNDKSSENADESALKNEGDEVKSEQDLKINKFLDEIDAPSKAFQRKKRIAFDVIPNKPKAESQENTEPVSTTYTTTYDNDEKYGLGFQEKTTEETNRTPKEISSSVGKNSISFIKGETINTPTEEHSKPSPAVEAKRIEFKALIETTTEKLKFLSEGSPPASAVQVMAIQLQTLLSAWESKDLKEKYLCNWLTETSRELIRLEQTAAPPGWECQWDRSHKRYFYRNVSNGEVQWTYPETDVVGGTEEMELCTTPPPEQEESNVIEESSSNMEHCAPHPQEDSQPSNTETQSKAVLAPPPPQISSPSPPPPPRICAEDLKRGKKRKGEQETTYDNKKEKSEQTDTSNPQTSTKSAPENQSTNSVNLTTSEPLPPGVDSPDISYSLPTSAMESTVLYTPTSQQSNPIYAATLGNAAVPLLAHHTALMQGQLMHYPAYHPLHNQMIMATANRLTEQDSIQFMVADYSRIYENNQVIAKPPVKAMQRESMCSEIDSFYNDIASIEQNNKMENEMGKKNTTEIVPSTTVQVQQSEAEKSPASIDPNVKEKKKKKTKLGISKKQKEVSSMVAKWQKVQKNFAD